MPPKERKKAFAWPHLHWLTALLGFVLIALGQLCIASDVVPEGKPTALGQWLNQSLHLDIPSVDNVIFGSSVLLIGGVFLVVALRGSRPLFSQEPAIEEKSIPGSLLRNMWPWILLGLVIFGSLLFLLNKQENRVFLLVLWLVSIFVFATITFVFDRRRRIDLSPHLTRQDLIWLIGLLIIGFVIGTYRLQGIPDQLIEDEGNFWTTARDIATGIYKPFIFGSGVYSFPILSSIWQGMVMKVFGITLWGWRFASVLPGILTTIPLYLLARDLFNRRIAVVSSVILVTNPYFLTFARLGYNNIQALFVTVLALYWLYVGMRRTSSLLIFLSGCAIGLSFYSYFSARGVLLIAIALILFMWVTRKIKFRQVSHAFTLLILGTVLVAAPHFVYALHQDALSLSYKTFESAFFNTFNGELFYSDTELFRYAPPINISGSELFYNPSIYLVLVTRGLIRSLLVFQKPWIVSEHFIAFPLAGTVGALFYLLGLGYVIKNIKQSRNLLIALWFLVNITIFSAFNTVPPRHTHMVAILPALALLSGVGLDAFVRILADAFAWVRKRKTIILVLGIVAIGFGGLFDYFVTSPEKYHPQPEQIMSWAGLESHGESFVYMYQDASQKDFIPYVMSEIRTSVPFETISVDNVINGDKVFIDTQKTVIFYSPKLVDKIVPILSARWGDNLIQRVFYNAEGKPVLAAGMNTPFIFERNRTFTSTLLDAFHYPAFDIFLSLLFALLALAAFLPATKVFHLPTWFVRLVAWFNRPEQHQEKETEAVDRVWLEATSELPREPDLAEPPTWATELPLSNQSPKSGRPGWEFKSISTAQGKAFYIKIHVPAIKLPWSSLPGGVDFSVPSIRIPGSVLLILSFSLAVVAQYLISRQAFLAGALFYLTSATGLIIWAYKNPKWSNVFTNQLWISHRAEILFAFLLFLASAFTRFYDLAYRVYGLEGDETKWTIQSWFSTILQVDRGDFASMHYQNLPVDFWLRSIFLRLFGQDFLSARIESAFLSLVSALLLYLLVRRLTASKPLAWLATLLYSFSFVELNLAHQALAETTPEVWIIGGIYFFVISLQERKAWQFQLTGIILALGVLTYDTFFPTPIVVLVFLIGFVSFRIARNKDAVRTWLRAFLLITWPIALVYFIFIHSYLGARYGYYLGGLLSFGDKLNAATWVAFAIRNLGNLLQTTFSHIVWTDSLVNWAGPFINPILLPFVVIGFVYNLWNMRRPYFALIPIWYLVNSIAAVTLGSVYPRVMYTCLAPLMIWGAMGLWTFLATLRAWFNSLKLKLAMPVFILLLATIVFFDYHIFTTSLSDPSDRQQRRELADLAAKSTSEVPMILFPYELNGNDPLEVETDVILFSVAGARNTNLEATKYFQQIEFTQILSILWQEHQVSSLDLFFDKSVAYMQEQRNTTLALVLRCYPNTTLRESGQFFDVYRFDSGTLEQPKCYGGSPPVIVSPQDESDLPFGNAIILEWNTNGVESTGHIITVERKTAGTYWIEAEDSFEGGGWYTSDFVNGFSGKGFLQDGWQSENAQYSFPVPESGQYQIWIKTYKRRINDQHNFVEIAGRKTEFATSSNVLDTWVWENLGMYDLTEGQLPITLSRTYGEDEEFSVFIDGLLITSDLVNPPNQIKTWESILNTGKISSPANQFTFAEVLPRGEYRWKVRVFDGDRLIDSNGIPGIESQYGMFTIAP